MVNKGSGHGAEPIYHQFFTLAMQLAPQGTLIHPARFLFHRGKTPQAWNQKMLSDPHFRIVRYWSDSTAVFPTVDVKGGIAISQWDAQMQFDAIGFFSPHAELRSLVAKVQRVGAASLASIVAPRELYRLTERLYAEHPELEGRQSHGHRRSIGANIFDVFPELFTETPQGDPAALARVYGRMGGQRCYRWCSRSYLTGADNFDKYKVLLPKSNGTGALGEELSTPIVAEPGVAYTDTFIGIGAFETQAEAQACLLYIQSKFARALLATRKTTQDNPKATWSHIPLQDFTPASDLDWSQPLGGLDRQLYEKYQLSGEEIDFVERMVRPMG